MAKDKKDKAKTAAPAAPAFDEERADALLHDFLQRYFPIPAPWEK